MFDKIFLNVLQPTWLGYYLTLFHTVLWFLKSVLSCPHSISSPFVHLICESSSMLCLFTVLFLCLLLCINVFWVCKLPFESSNLFLFLWIWSKTNKDLLFCFIHDQTYGRFILCHQNLNSKRMIILYFYHWKNIFDIFWFLNLFWSFSNKTGFLMHLSNC